MDACAADDYSLNDTVACTPREGLPNFFAKLKAGGELKNPTKYAPTDWYAGGIFIIGELAK